MRGAALIALAVVIGCGAGSTAAATMAEPSTSLTISYWPEGTDDQVKKTATLRCDPVGGTLGTLAREREACRRLAAFKNPFAPPDPDLLCTQQYGGPDQALITGTYKGRRVWIRLALTDGCQIARFKKLGFLIPGYR